MPSFWRLLARILSPKLQCWDTAVAHKDGILDTAAPRQDVRRAGLERQLRAEVATLRHKPFAQLLWDVKGFFDAVKLPHLIPAAMRLGMPLDSLYPFANGGTSNHWVFYPDGVHVEHEAGEGDRPSPAATLFRRGLRSLGRRDAHGRARGRRQPNERSPR